MASLQEIHSENYSDMPFDDFARRYHQKFYSDMPYDEFASKAGMKPAVANENPATGVSTGADIGKSIVSGLGKGAAGTVGMIPDITGLMRQGFNAALDYATGAKPPQFPAGQGPGTALGIDLNRLGTTPQILSGIKSVVPLHEPQTTAGKFASRAAEFIPGAVLGPGGAARNAIVGASAGLASEAGGQLAKGTAAEPYARMAGAVAGGILPAMASKAITPLSIIPERAAALKALEAEGVPVTAGQATGFKPLQYMESALGDIPGAGGKAAERMLEQQRAFTQAAMKRGGGVTATASGMDDAFSTVGKKFDNLSANTTGIVDNKFAQSVGETARKYIHTIPAAKRVPLFGQIIDEIIGVSRANGGKIAGEQYKSWRSLLTDAMRGSSSSEFKIAAGGLIEALDGTMMRGAGKAAAKSWVEARRQYRNLFALEQAATGAGENAAMGFISPSALRNAVVNQGRRSYARGKGDLAGLARAGEAVMRPLPQSGTAPRAFAQGLLSGGGFMAGGLPGAIAGIAGPAIAGRALMSAPVQAYLRNQVIPNMQSRYGLLAAPENALLSALIRTRPALPPVDNR